MNNERTVIYKGFQYNITGFMDKHPGGRDIIEKYIHFNKDITQVFKAIHSQQAQKKLLKFINQNKIERSKNGKIYLKIQDRVSKLYENSYFFQILTIVFLVILASLSLWTNSSLLAISLFTFIQVLTVWAAHSLLHSHISFSQRTGKFLGALFLGLSAKWWKKKHIVHHLFTNNQQLDQDINHNYRTLYFPFLLFKWRIQSIITVIKTFSFSQMCFIALHYYLILKMRIPLLIVGELIASLYISLIIFGNHEREKRYKRQFLDDFLSHQLATTVDYDFQSQLMLYALGGFQFHSQHHLFPQIPYYNLKKASKIIKEELQIYKKDISISHII